MGYFNVELGYEIGLIWVFSLKEKLGANSGLFVGQFKGGNGRFGWGNYCRIGKILELNSRVTRAIFQDGTCNCKNLKHETRLRCP